MFYLIILDTGLKTALGGSLGGEPYAGIDINNGLGLKTTKIGRGAGGKIINAL